MVALYLVDSDMGRAGGGRRTRSSGVMANLTGAATDYSAAAAGGSGHGAEGTEAATPQRRGRPGAEKTAAASIFPGQGGRCV